MHEGKPLHIYWYILLEADDNFGAEDEGKIYFKRNVTKLKGISVLLSDD